MNLPFKNSTLTIDSRTVGLFSTNSCLVVCAKTREAVLIDASGEAEVLIEMIEGHKVKLKYILQTHAHIDHVAALDEIKKWSQAPILIHKGEKMLYENIPMQCKLFGLPPIPSPPPPDQWIKEGDKIQFGELEALVHETPGHTPGSVSFQIASDYLFSGDTLFAGSIGRTDLPGGDRKVMKKTLKRLLKFPDKMHVLSGHSAPTTIGKERRTNPFLQDMSW